MKDFKKINIFIADKIHPKGIQNLKKTGFTVIECYGLDNKALIDFIYRKKDRKDNHFLELAKEKMKNINGKENTQYLWEEARKECVDLWFKINH